MAIEIHVEGKLEKAEQREVFTTLLQQVCNAQKIKMEDYDTHVIITVCPQGYIECTYTGCFIHIEAQTNVAGPGFHAFVCSFLDHLLEETFLELQVQDATLYFEQRNFEDLKYRCFYPWLQDVFDQIEICMGKEQDVCIAWPEESYVPKKKEHHIVTPMGYMTFQDIYTLEMETLAQRFFIWNDATRNATYYRNCALSLLWTECYYTYSTMNEDSAKIADMIMDYMEAAYEQDNHIVLPMKAYHLLCETMQRENLLEHAKAGYDDVIGYRMDVVHYPFQGWRVAVDGCSEKAYDRVTQTLHFMAPYNHAEEAWRWMIRIHAYTLEEAQFAQIFQSPQAFSYMIKEMELKGCLEKEEDYFVLRTQVIHKQDTLFMEGIIKEEADIERIKAWMLQVQHLPKVERTETLH